MTDLSDRFQRLIDFWERWHKPSLLQHLDWYEVAGCLQEAIRRASNAEEDASKKRSSHQRRLPKVAPSNVHRVLLANSDRIRECTDFVSLHAVVKLLIDGEHGVGVLMIYDTALRLGAYLGTYPDLVYLHRGALDGAKRYFSTVGSERKLKSGSSLPSSDFEYLEGKLSSFEIEHFLCTMKDRIDLGAPLCPPETKARC